MTAFVAGLCLGAAVYLVGYSLWYVLASEGGQHDC
jgi:glucokinase